MFKRIALFLATNLAVLLLLSVVMSVFGIDPRTNGGLLVMAVGILGFGGSIISLLMSKWIAKKTTGAYVITQPRNEVERWLLSTVQRQAQAAGIGMPEVAIYEAPEINAFATGANRNNALVAVSTGLLRAMDRDEAEAVLAHEVSHVANGDMVTMALIQGVLNTFVIVLARIVGRVVDGFLNPDREEGSVGIGYFRHGVRAGTGVRPVRQHDRDVVLALARVPRRCRRRAVGRSRQDDRRAAAPVAHLRREHAAQAGAGVRHLRRRRPRPAQAVPQPPAAGGAHRGPGAGWKARRRACRSRCLLISFHPGNDGARRKAAP